MKEMCQYDYLGLNEKKYICKIIEKAHWHHCKKTNNKKQTPPPL